MPTSTQRSRLPTGCDQAVLAKLRAGGKLVDREALEISRTVRDNPGSVEEIARAARVSADALQKLGSVVALSEAYAADQKGQRAQSFREVLDLEKQVLESGMLANVGSYQKATRLHEQLPSDGPVKEPPLYDSLLASRFPLEAAGDNRVSMREIVALCVKAKRVYPPCAVLELAHEGHTAVVDTLKEQASDTCQQNQFETLEKRINQVEALLSVLDSPDAGPSADRLASTALYLQEWPDGEAFVRNAAICAVTMRRKGATVPEGFTNSLEKQVNKIREKMIELGMPRGSRLPVPSDIDSDRKDQVRLRTEAETILRGAATEMQVINRLIESGYVILQVGLDSIKGVPLRQGCKNLPPYRQSKREIDVVAYDPRERKLVLVEAKSSRTGIMRSAYDQKDITQLRAGDKLGRDGQLWAYGVMSTRADILSHCARIAGTFGIAEQLATKDSCDVMFVVPQESSEPLKGEIAHKKF